MIGLKLKNYDFFSYKFWLNILFLENYLHR